MENALKYCSGTKWKVVKNSSWGELHKRTFGEKEGYVVTYTKNNQMIALGSVIGQPFVSDKEVEANAKIMTVSLEAASLVVSLSILNENHYTDLKGFILKARELAKQLEM